MVFHGSNEKMGAGVKYLTAIPVVTHYTGSLAAQQVPVHRSQLQTIEAGEMHMISPGLLYKLAALYRSDYLYLMTLASYMRWQ